MRNHPPTQELEIFLDLVDDRIRTEILSAPAAHPALPLVYAGGKRLRTRLLWLSADAVGARIPASTGTDLERAAAAIEIAHLGSLIHDDIVDDADTRRNVPTLHRTHTVDVAVRTGTTLLHLASALTARFPGPLRRRIASAIEATCRGQVLELSNLFRVGIQQERLTIVRQKTSAFFELAAHLGACFAWGPSLELSSLRRFARRYGIAFQITDDIADLVGDRARLGRGNGADLRDGVITLPMILACERSPALRRTLERSPPFRNVGPSDCIEQIISSGGIKAAAREGRRWLHSAQTALDACIHPRNSSRLQSMVMALATELDALENAQPAQLVASREPGGPLDLRSLLSTDPPRAMSRGDGELSLERRLRRIHSDLALADRWIEQKTSRVPRVREIDSSTASPGQNALPIRMASRAATLSQQAMAIPSAPRREIITIADCFDAVSIWAAAQAPSDWHLNHEQAVLSFLSGEAQREPSQETAQSTFPFTRGAPEVSENATLPQA